MKKPIIGITMGDPAGVGPEICLHALGHLEVTGRCVPAVFGDHKILHRCAKQLELPLHAPTIAYDHLNLEADLNEPTIVDVPAVDHETFQPGQVGANTGAASYAYINRAIDATLAGHVAAVTTAPINKEALSQAGVRFPGHTDIFAYRAGSKRWCMMQYSEEITCTFVTVHVGYAEVPQLLTTDRVLEVIQLSAENLKYIRGRKPKIVVCGLNPHAGEHGLFGDNEEERVIIPAIETARRQGMNIEGPLPPDTAFLPRKRKTTDVFVCMYHDQGHIPVKALAFDSAVNTTLGLPIIRTSVDHGTALDIAWQGKATPASLYSAIRLAVKLSGQSS
ncbi:MAG: 4-hydroxythreonine-4-phosphate dehydrogenase 2 [Verrucomicrobia subdivision 3 bacterium]|nr:4-hydroxythreonine-4-phosphate dehydrogenase 2 [Limisphaerales bacterium]MCS1414350.1 4-hydroxythreonine-4-phosphate dehydrogenase 2 [Limisphaerales bacterium]